ncbi:MAG TPA: hypothetical protein VJV79_34025 [Polyangiaceae bacterium]|nr:hypothetical protein [Polyangiaceae bacterium]
MTEAEDAPQLPVPAPAPGAPEAGPALNAEGRERPRFLLEFPDDPALQRLVSAFEAGNYQAVRQGAAKLAQSTDDPIVRAAARELGSRIEPDPLMKYLLFVALGLFVFVVWHTYQGQH